jgi:hypothetical protein
MDIDNQNKKSRLNLFLSETFEQEKFSVRESNLEGKYIILIII